MKRALVLVLLAVAGLASSCGSHSKNPAKPSGHLPPPQSTNVTTTTK